ncbi:MAG TPA: chemotaxis protein CheW [Candidatus Acidoferrum sp.]
MTVAAEPTLQSFVLLRIGERRFALPASQVAELVAPSRVFRFPHTSPALEGVILRRGRMIAVCDIAEQLNGKKLDTRRFNLLATRKYGSQQDWIAIPVSGECELINADMIEASSSDSPHVDGWLSHAGEVIEVLRLSALTPGPPEAELPAPLNNFAEARS